jgi:hypothetical protein
VGLALVLVGADGTPIIATPTYDVAPDTPVALLAVTENVGTS